MLVFGVTRELYFGSSVVVGATATAADGGNGMTEAGGNSMTLPLDVVSLLLEYDGKLLGKNPPSEVSIQCSSLSLDCLCFSSGGVAVAEPPPFPLPHKFTAVLLLLLPVINGS